LEAYQNIGFAFLKRSVDTLKALVMLPEEVSLQTQIILHTQAKPKNYWNGFIFYLSLEA
jgi:hypothetical protein